ENEVISASDLESQLKRLGYTIRGMATSAEAALDLIDQEQPDLILMDIVLGGKMDGIEAATIIKDKWGIPVVFLTAYAEQTKLEQAKLTLPFGYLLKPFKPRDLKVTIEMALYVAKEESERRKAEAKYRIFFDEGPDAVVVLDPSTARIIEFNDQACHQLGYSREEFSKLSVPDIEM
ncbi:MAG: response regulator, partial [Deltaproteobacteria bacterium]|nr:response regulator [Deltaproteobacteria bacterium]